MRWGIAALCALLTGCASPMVRTYPAGQAPSDASWELLGEYGLATSKVLVTISAPPAGGGDKDDSAASPSVNFNSTITVTTADKKDDKPDAGPAKPDTQASVCADIRKTYNQDRVAAMTTVKRHADFLVTVRTWKAVPPKGKDDVSAALKVVDAFLARRAADQTAITRLLALAPLIVNCPQPVLVDLKEVLEVDDTNTYRLYAVRPVLGDNTITVELDGGYLKTVNATADDRTADVIVQGLASIGQIYALGQPLPVATAFLQADEGAARRIARATDQIADAARKLHAAAGFTPAALAEMDSGVSSALAEMRQQSLPDPIDVDLPFHATYTLDELRGAGKTPLDLLKISISAVCTPHSPGATVKPGSYFEGVLVPGERGCTITARRAGPGGTPQEVGRVRFAAADASSASLLPVPRQPFVKESSVYSFASGRLSKTEDVRPSPAVTIVSLPARAIGGVTGAIADGLKGRQGVTEAETNRVKAETDRIKAARELQALKQEKPPAPTGSASTAASTSP